MKIPVVSEIGARFGRLTVVERAAGVRTKILCRCECGAEKRIRFASLRSGVVQSCGCWRDEVMLRAAVTHGRCYTPEYHCWSAMRQRCFNPKVRCYADYGGRGITVCSRWRDSFENFFADMGPRPSPKHSIDRRDNDSDYSPSNCRWSTKSEQQKNQRRRKRRT